MANGYSPVADGEAITPTLWNEQVAEQVVSIFANTTARDAAHTSPHNGAMCYITADFEVQVYNGTTWKVVYDAT